MERHKTVIIVGAGLAGLSCAHQVLQLSTKHNVVILEKLAKAGGNSIKASSGINGAGTQHQKVKDSPEQFFDDTVKSAKGLGKPELMKVLSERSAQAVTWLEQDFGIDLSTVAQLGGHSVARTHRGGGKLPPGFAIISALCKPLEDKIWPNCRVLELVREQNQVTGVRYMQDSEERELKGQVVLTTGGFSGSQEMLKQYRPDIAHLPTTNGPQTQGEGQQMCGAIDARLFEMDQVQIHPTGFVDPADPLNGTKFLAGEALRGEGGVLLDVQGKRFVDELQTRDVVSRAIMDRGGDPTLVLDQHAYSRIQHHVDFYMMKGLMRSGSLDELKTEFGWTAAPEVVPGSETYYWGVVTPVVHFTMGGVETTAQGHVIDKTGHVIPNLYAAGEVTGGVHGANRLGGSSLLECVVFGRIIAESLVKN